MELPPMVIEIGTYAFSECSFIDTVTIPKGLENMIDIIFPDSNIQNVFWS